jgi:hypothetical protein
MYAEALQSLVAGTEWEVGAFGDSFVCPCGDEIELDGECPEGCVSPMVSMGFI